MAFTCCESRNNDNKTLNDCCTSQYTVNHVNCTRHPWAPHNSQLEAKLTTQNLIVIWCVVHHRLEVIPNSLVNLLTVEDSDSLKKLTIYGKRFILEDCEVIKKTTVTWNYSDFFHSAHKYFTLNNVSKYYQPWQLGKSQYTVQHLFQIEYEWHIN